MTRAHVAFRVLLLAAVVVAAPVARAAELVSPGEARQAVGGRTCRVVAANAAGMPLAYATGFLMGDGRFVFTDLASMRQTGVARADLEFEDGTRAHATQFAMAMPAVGLAVLKMEGGPAARGGVTLATEVPDVADPPGIATVGWLHGERMDVVTGWLIEGPTAEELAEAAGVDPPSETLTLLKLTGGALAGTSAAPIVDASGEIAAVYLNVKAEGNVAVAMPAAVVRRLLIGQRPELRPLAELPAPHWPIHVRRLPGDPGHPVMFARTVRSIKLRARCGRCKGKGTVKVKVFDHWVTIGTTRKAIYRYDDHPCPTCHGETVEWRNGMYGPFATLAEQGTRLRYAPELDKAATDAVTESAREVVEAMARVGGEFRGGLAREAAVALHEAREALPTGVFLYTQVRETIEGPDGKYVALAAYESPYRLVVRFDEAQATGPAVAPATPASEAAYGRWIVLAGLAQRQVSLKGEGFILVRPLAWAPGPNLGPAPPRPGTRPPGKPSGPPDREPAGNRDREPGDFFGL